MKRRASILAVLIVAALAIGCATSAMSGYPAAAATYDSDSQAYEKASNNINAVKTSLSAAKWSQFKSDEAAVRAADVFVFDDLKAWENAPTVKPAQFDAHAATLKAAQNKVIAFAAEVTR